MLFGFSCRGEPSSARIRVKTESELMGDPQCSSSSWLSHLNSPFSSTPKSTAYENPDTLKRKRFCLPPDSTSAETLPRNNFPVSKKPKHSSAGPASRKKSWQCVFCMSYFTTKASLNCHLEKCLRCSRCFQEFSCFRDKVIHEADHISIVVDKINEKNQILKKSKSVNHVERSEGNHTQPMEILACPTCSELFHSNRMLLDHEKIIHGRFRCASCSEAFDSQKALNSHKRVHIVKQPSNKKPFEKEDNEVPKKQLSCNICYEEFDDENTFVLHLYHHATEQSDDESMPPKKLRKGQKEKKSNAGSENASEQFSVKCERCHVVCRSKEYYNVHLATHLSKVKTQFPCSGCFQDFRNVEALNRHTCSGNKQPNELKKCCLDCGQGLVDGEDHVCDNKCPECDKVFKSARGQRLHYTHKHGKKDFLSDFDTVNVNDSDQNDVPINQSEVGTNHPAQILVDSSDSVVSDCDDCNCSDDSSRSLGDSPPGSRLPPDGASITEALPSEFDTSQSKISQNQEVNQNALGFEGAF